jgi:hypothetical protein
VQSLSLFSFGCCFLNNEIGQVVEERWGSLGQLTVSVASRRAAPSHAHLHAIKDRKRGLTEERSTSSGKESQMDVRKVPCHSLVHHWFFVLMLVTSICLHVTYLCFLEERCALLEGCIFSAS